MVSFESVTLALALEIVTTVAAWPASTIVVGAPEPTIFKGMPIFRFSVYVAAATMIESPDFASETACPMVSQAVVGDMQLLLSLPLTPFTYHVVLARAVGTRARNGAITNAVSNLLLMIFSVRRLNRQGVANESFIR